MNKIHTFVIIHPSYADTSVMNIMQGWIQEFLHSKHRFHLIMAEFLTLGPVYTMYSLSVARTVNEEQISGRGVILTGG